MDNQLYWVLLGTSSATLSGLTFIIITIYISLPKGTELTSKLGLKNPSTDILLLSSALVLLLLSLPFQMSIAIIASSNYNAILFSVMLGFIVLFILKSIHKLGMGIKNIVFSVIIIVLLLCSILFIIRSKFNLFGLMENRQCINEIIAFLSLILGLFLLFVSMQYFIKHKDFYTTKDSNFVGKVNKGKDYLRNEFAKLKRYYDSVPAFLSDNKEIIDHLYSQVLLKYIREDATKNYNIFDKEVTRFLEYNPEEVKFISLTSLQELYDRYEKLISEIKDLSMGIKDFQEKIIDIKSKKLS